MAEASATVIEEHRELLVGDEEEILVGIIVEVEKERLGGSVEEIDPGFAAGIGEGAILLGAVEQVGKAGGGEYIEIFEPIAVGIAAICSSARCFPVVCAVRWSWDMSSLFPLTKASS